MSKGSIIAKFGGTSLADAAAISQAAKVAADNGAALVVVSAVAGTTNRLVALTEALLAPEAAKAEALLVEITAGHRKIAEELEAGPEVQAELDELFDGLRLVTARLQPGDKERRTVDHILSFGELLSSKLMQLAIERQGRAAGLVDAREVIKTDDTFGHATPLIEEIRERAGRLLAPQLGPQSIVVTQGFIGSAADGATTTLGRGGSDYSAALLAEALGAGLLQIWTDVAGIASTDPRIVEAARPIEQMTLQEAAELATAGAKVLYPKTITPLRRANIPLYVGNTFEPGAGGTTIVTDTEHRPRVRAIALKRNQCLLSLTNPEMAYQFGYLARAFEVFADFKVSIDQISTSEITVAVVMEHGALTDGRLQRRLEAMGEVTIEKGLSVISVIGNDVNNAPGLAQDIFGTLKSEGDRISIRMICQGASRHNFCFLVADKYGTSTVQRLHQEFIE